jgi:AcrR family transcriptional regulator
MTRLIHKIPITRSTYRHGDLKRALLETSVMLARDGGPDALILREVTRRVGVAPNAAYRYFASRQALLKAVQSSALALMAVFIENETAKLPSELTAVDFAFANLRAVGTGYLKFAQAESGLFRVVFAIVDDVDPTQVNGDDLEPFQLFRAALDQLVDAKVLTTENKISAQYFVWSSVHGLATLILNGSLNHMTHQQVKVLEQKLFDRIEKGL